MTSIHDLSPELLRACFEPLYSEKSPTSLRQLNLVCHSFHDVASRFLFRNIRISLKPSYHGPGSLNDEQTTSQSIALITFLKKRPDLRAFIKNINIYGVTTFFHQNSFGACQDALEALLPELPHLKTVEIHPTHGFWRVRTKSESHAHHGTNYPMCQFGAVAALEGAQRAKDRPYRQPLLTIIEALNVKIRLDGLRLAQDPGLLNDITQLQSLNVQPSKATGQYGNKGDTLDIESSATIADIIVRNPNMRHLGIQLDDSIHNQSQLKQQEKQHSLKNLDRVLAKLESISLEGDVSSKPGLWAPWSNSFPRLQSLHLRGPDIIQDVVDSPDCNFPALRSLSLDLRHLEADIWTMMKHQFDRAKLTEEVQSFISNLNLDYLSLVDFDTRVLPEPESNASNMIRLCIHQLMTHAPSRSHMWLSTEALQSLLHSYEALEWLAIDVPPFNISIVDGVRMPVPFIPKDTFPEYPYRLRLPEAILQRWEEMEEAQVRYPRLPRGTHGQPMDLAESIWILTNKTEQQFPALAAHRPLRHLRLFQYMSDLGSSAPPSWTLSTTDAIYTFLFFRSDRSSCKLQSLTIHGTIGKGHKPSISYVIEELGENAVQVFDSNLGQLWDVSDPENLKLVSSHELLEEDWERDGKDEHYWPKGWF